MRHWAQTDLTQSIHLGIIIDEALSSLRNYVQGRQSDKDQQAALGVIRDVLAAALDFARGQVKPGPPTRGIRSSQAYLLILRGLPDVKNRDDADAVIARILSDIDRAIAGTLETDDVTKLQHFLKSVGGATMDESSEIVAAYESLGHHRL